MRMMSHAAAASAIEDRAADEELEPEQAVQRRVGLGERYRLREHVAVWRR